jgi:hypothetical protein
MTHSLSTPANGERRLRRRWPAVLGVFLGAPITAEYLQAYLPSTGDLLVMLASLLLLAPLYGGAALLIREIAVRRGLGWTGIVLLSAAFGLAMPGLVDLSLFTEHDRDIAYWTDMRQATLVEPLGISVYSAISWVSGHILMSIGAPLALLDALAPHQRQRPLLGRPGIVVVSVLCVLAALAIRNDALTTHKPAVSLAQSLAVLAVVALLVALAFSPLARPAPHQERPPIRPVWIALAGALGMFTVDVLPWTWTGTATMTLLLLAAAIAIRRYATIRHWSSREIGALAAGAVIGRCVIGFLSPVPDGAGLAAKLAQNTILVSAALAITWLVTRRTEQDPANVTPGPGRAANSTTE